MPIRTRRESCPLSIHRTYRHFRPTPRDFRHVFDVSSDLEARFLFAGRLGSRRTTARRRRHNIGRPPGRAGCLDFRIPAQVEGENVAPRFAVHTIPEA